MPRFEANETEEIKMNMTSMIDIVFQLLVFFVMTFNPPQYEGDFSVKMPLNSDCLLYTSPSPRDKRQSRMPSSA